MSMALFDMLIQPLDNSPLLLALLGLAAVICLPGIAGFGLLLGLCDAPKEVTDAAFFGVLGMIALGIVEGVAFAFTGGISIYAPVPFESALLRCFIVAEVLGLVLIVARMLRRGLRIALRASGSAAFSCFCSFAVVYTALSVLVVLGIFAIVGVALGIFFLLDMFG